MKRKTGNKSHYGKYQKNNKRLRKILPCYCTGSGSDWGNFLHSSPYGAALLWICGKNSAGNTPVLWLLLTIACTASRFHFCPTLPAPATRPGVSKKLGENTVGTNWPKPTLFQAHQKNWRGDWANACFWEVAIAFAELAPTTLLSFTFCAFISTLCCSHSLPHAPEGGRKQLGSVQAAGQGQPWWTAESGQLYTYFFFNIH